MFYLSQSLEHCGHLLVCERCGHLVDELPQHLVQQGCIQRLMQLVQQRPHRLTGRVCHQSHVGQPEPRVHSGSARGVAELHLEALGRVQRRSQVRCEVDVHGCVAFAHVEC